MPLIPSKSAAAAASLLARVQQLAGNYQAGASHLNAIVRDLLALGDDDLAAFANQLGPQGLYDLTTLHGLHGAAINQLAQEAAGILAESGVSWPAASVDVRPLTEKLADQGRQLLLVEGVFSVEPVAPVEA